MSEPRAWIQVAGSWALSEKLTAKAMKVHQGSFDVFLREPSRPLWLIVRVGDYVHPFARRTARGIPQAVWPGRQSDLLLLAGCHHLSLLGLFGFWRSGARAG